MLLRKLAAWPSAGFMSVSMRPAMYEGDGDPAWGPDRGQAPGQACESRLGHRVQGHPGGGDAVGQRAADRDDPAALAHVPGGSLAGYEHHSHIDGAQPVGLADRRLLDGPLMKTPALLTRMSSRPSSCTVCSTAATLRSSPSVNQAGVTASGLQR